MIIVYSDDVAKGLSLAKEVRENGGSARYLAASQFSGPNDVEPNVSEAWLIDGPHEAIEAAYGEKIVAKYKEQRVGQATPTPSAPDPEPKEQPAEDATASTEAPATEDKSHTRRHRGRKARSGSGE